MNFLFRDLYPPEADGSSSLLLGTKPLMGFSYFKENLYLEFMLQVRMANASDAAGILSIYKPYIENTSFTFETEVPSIEQFGKRIETYLQKWPWIICEIDGLIAGYVYGAGYRERTAYQWSCECSVYIHEDYKGKGLGQHLYEALFPILKLQGFNNVYAVINLPNELSVKLHEKCGLEWFATYENVGYKLGRWKNVGWWRLKLNDYNSEPAPPLKLSETDQDLIAEIFRTAANKIAGNIKG